MKKFKLLLLGVLLCSTEIFAQGSNLLTPQVLWEHLSQDSGFRAASGWMSQAEINKLNSLDPQSKEFYEFRNQALRRYLRAAQADLENLKTNPGRDLPHVNTLNRLKAEGFDVSPKALENLNNTLRQPYPETGNQLALRTRAKILGRTGGRFALADVALLGAYAWKERKDQEIMSALQRDAQNSTCPSEPSDAYVKMFLFEEMETQKKIMAACHPTDVTRTQSLYSKVSAERKTYRDHFSTGKAHCEYNHDSKPVVTAVSDAGVEQKIFFTKEGQFERVLITPQPRSGGRPSKYDGSYLEYSHFPEEQSVRYYAVTPQSPESAGPKLDRHHMNSEPLNSFSARIYCAVESCKNDTPEFRAIRQDESFQNFSSAKPFGDVTANKEFLVSAAKALAQFRLGIEENFQVPLTFRNVCLSLGSIPPKGSGTDPVTITNPVFNPQQETPEAAR